MFEFCVLKPDPENFPSILPFRFEGRSDEFDLSRPFSWTVCGDVYTCTRIEYSGDRCKLFGPSTRYGDFVWEVRFPGNTHFQPTKIFLLDWEPPRCECGSKYDNGFHSTWCPMYKELTDE